MGFFRTLLGIDQIEAKLDALIQKVDVTLRVANQSNQLTILLLRHMGLDVRVLTPEEAAKEIEKAKAAAASGREGMN